MAKFINIGYGDRAGDDCGSEALREAAHAHDARMTAEGALIGMAGDVVQVRNPERAGVQTTAGPYLRSDLPIAGGAVIDAAWLHQGLDVAVVAPTRRLRACDQWRLLLQRDGYQRGRIFKRGDPMQNVAS